MKNFNLSPLGAGIGLRHQHFAEIISNRPKLGWLEIIVEDFMGQGGPAIEQFQEIAKYYPIVGHSVCMSIGSSDPLDFEYLANYREFLREINSPWTSDHLCFTMVDHSNLNELLPLPFTIESANNVIERVKIVQNELERPFLLENVTRYLTLSDREMSELEFINTILEEANCGLLLDLTNVYLNSKVFDFDPLEFIKALPLSRVGQIHLAGYEPNSDGSIIDSHDAPVTPEVWDLLEKTLSLIGPTSVLIERDRNLPPIESLASEAASAETLINKVCGAWR